MAVSDRERLREQTPVLDAKCERLAKLIAEKFRGKMSIDSIREFIEAAVGRTQELDLPDDEVASKLDLWINNIDAKKAEFVRQRTALKSLRWHILSRRKKPLREALGRFVEQTTKHWAVASAVFALLAAVIARVGYDRYYAKFDLSPEEAGIDSVRMIAGSIPGVLLLVLTISAIIALVQIPAYSVMNASEWRLLKGVGRQSRVDLVWFILTAAVVLVLIPCLFRYVTNHLNALPRDLDASPTYLSIAASGPIGVIAGMAIVTILAVLTAFRMWWRGAEPYVMIQARSYFAAVIGVAPMVLVLVFIFVPLVAGGYGHKVLDGDAVRPAAFLGVPVLDIRATRVSVSKPPLPRGCHLLIGTGDTATFIYDTNSKIVYRLPKGEVTLSLSRDLPACRAIK